VLTLIYLPVGIGQQKSIPDPQGNIVEFKNHGTFHNLILSRNSLNPIPVAGFELGPMMKRYSTLT
jgi:hypothetical protein